MSRNRSERSAKLDLRSVLSLRANQRTYLATGSGAQVYFLQPDAGAAGLQRLETSGEVKPTAFTPARIAELLGETQTLPALRAIESLGDGRILGYFSGASRRRSLSCIAIYEPVGDNVRVIIPPEELARASGMGITVDLADGQLARTGNTVWLWLRHVDRSAFLTLDTRAMIAGSARLGHPFDELKTSDGPLKFADSDVLVTQTDETLWLFRQKSGELWRLSRDGQAFSRPAPEHRPAMSVMPLLLRTEPGNRGESWLHFFPAPEVSLEDRQLPGKVEEVIRYPAVITKDKVEEMVIDRDHLEVRPAFPRHALRFTKWVIEPASGDVIAYDAMSGEVFRMSWRAR